MLILISEFQSQDEEMKKIVLKVVKQCVGTEGVEPDYIRNEVRRREARGHVCSQRRSREGGVN